MAVLFLLASGGSPASAQEVLLLPSATQPSPGTFLIRTQVRSYQGPVYGNQIATPFSISMGVFPRHSLTISGAGNFSQAGGGMDDLDALWKWRFYTQDSGPLNTSRTALLTGVQLPTGTDAWSTGGVSPYAGVAHTEIVGRLGLGFASLYKLNTGKGARIDPSGTNSKGGAWQVGASAVWRLHPTTYTAHSTGALYTGLEGAWTGTDQGDSIRFGPILFYEASTWVLEVGWQYYPLNAGGMQLVESMGVVGFRVFF